MNRIVLLTGPPGAGKGTQAEIIASQADWSTFSIGQILRERADSATKAIMESGKLLAADQVVGLVTAELARHTGAVIIDGFPRRLDQAEALDALLAAEGTTLPEVIHLVITKDESKRRLELRGRSDDAAAVWEQRWVEYEDKTVPAVEYYRAQSRLVEIDGNGSITAVSERLLEVLHAA